MTIKLFLAAAMLAVATSPTPGVAPDAGRAPASVAPAAWAVDDPADSLYRQAREALNRGDYREASRMFARIPAEFPQSVYAGDALYWQAFASYSIGETRSLRAAIDALDAQRDRYPRAATRGDAEALRVRVRGALAKLGDVSAAEEITTRAGATPKPCTASRRGGGDDDEDERIAALNALLQMNAEQAMPVLRQVLGRRDACSERLREKAVMLVSQTRSDEATDILLDVLQKDPSGDVRRKAVFWLGQVRSDRAAQALERLLNESGDEELREEAVMALMQQRTERGVAAVRAIAQNESAPSGVREKAVFWIGQHRSTENAVFLRGLFAKLAGAHGDEEVQKKILFSLSQMRGEGNDRWLMEVAADPKYTTEVRKQAVFSAGQANVATADLIALYAKANDSEVKKQVIWVLSDRRDPAAADRLIEIAKSDPDPEMRKKAIFWLGQSRNPRVRQLLLDIINGE